MKSKKIIIVCLFILAILSVGAVSASDDNVTAVAFDDSIADEALAADSDDDKLESTQSDNSNYEETIGQTNESVLSYSTSVSSYSDLADKIEDAKNTNYNDYTINLASGTYYATRDMIFWGGSDDSTATKTLIINGNGATLDGKDTYSFMKVGYNYTLYLKNLKMKNFAKYGASGYVDNICGGVVFVSNHGTLIIDSCEFINNHVDDMGGAIYSSGILVVKNTLFSGNTANWTAGAIKTDEGTCDIQSSTFEYNKAVKSGGAIYAGTNDAVIANNIFLFNEAGGNGGAIYNGNSRTFSYSTVIYDRWGNRIEGETQYFGLNTNISKNTFSHNKAKGGGAIYNYVYSILIESNVFKCNQVTSDASRVIENTGADTIVSGNNVENTNYYGTISNSGSYSRILNNIFDDTSLVITSDITATYSNSKISATFSNANGNALANTKVTFKIGTTSYSATTNSNGVATADVNLGAGTYTVTAVNPINKEEKQFKLVINKANSIIALKSTQSNGDATLTATLTPTSATGTVVFNVNGVNRNAQISNGKATLALKDLQAGNYTVTASYAGDNNLNPSKSNTVTFNVAEVYPILTANDLSKTYGTGNGLVVNLVDSRGNAIANAIVNVNINGNIAQIKTDANGKATMPVSLAPGTYTATASYADARDTAKIVVKKAKVKMTAKAKTFKKSVKTKKYTITLKNNLNKVMKNTKVTIKVNKKTYTAKTNKKGVATFKLKKLTKKGKYTATITYKGSSCYDKLTKKVKITVK